MFKLIWLGLVLSIFWRYQFGRWPWVSWKLWREPDGVARARQLLGVAEGARREDIIAAHKRLVVQVHPDRGGDVGLVHEANDARDILLAQLAPERIDQP